MTPHIPVMVQEVLEIYERALSDVSAPVFLDATLGAGGHTRAVLQKFPQARVIAFDQDRRGCLLAEENLSEYRCRIRIVNDNFRKIGDLRHEEGWSGIDGILFDLGVSNMQLTTPERGFSYNDDSPLDMRMDRDSNVPSARDLLYTCGIGELAHIFRAYGEERYAYPLAKAIVRAREQGKAVETGKALADLVRSTLPAPVQRKMGIHPARRIFQALRIAVNEELSALQEGLEGAFEICRDGGVIVVISYHSLEDRIVKRRFREWAAEKKGCIPFKRPMIPSEDEIKRNKKAKSAKLRVLMATKFNSKERCGQYESAFAKT